MFHGHVGPPSSPSLTVVAGSLQQIIFIISPPLYAGQCVVNYIITATSGDGSVVPDITVPVTDTEAPTLAVRSAFDFCNNTYTFTVMANTLIVAGESSMSVVVTRPDFFSEFDSCPQENKVSCNKTASIQLQYYTLLPLSSRCQLQEQ